MVFSIKEEDVGGVFFSGGFGYTLVPFGFCFRFAAMIGMILMRRAWRWGGTLLVDV